MSIDKKNIYVWSPFTSGVGTIKNVINSSCGLIKFSKSKLFNVSIINVFGEWDNYLDELKLKKIFERTLQLVDEYKPDEFAVEAPFFGKNVQSMLKLGRAQGVAMSAALYRNIPIFEYAPKKIKMAITGKGTSSKEQVAGMLKSILKINEMPKHLEARDGLAAAVCHYFQRNSDRKNKTYNNWSSFIKDNPKKIIKKS